MKKERSLDPRALDVAALSRNNETLNGTWPLASMQRLAESLAAVPDTSVAWSARGEAAAVAASEPELWMTLSAQANVGLLCQRCLQPFVDHLQLERRFRFVRHEDEAARLDEELEDDVLVLQQRLDLHNLLEDELILALPLVPRHAVCPEPLPLPADDEAEAAESDAAPNPFAALAALRRDSGGKSGGGQGG